MPVLRQFWQSSDGQSGQFTVHSRNVQRGGYGSMKFAPVQELQRWSKGNSVNLI